MVWVWVVRFVWGFLLSFTLWCCSKAIPVRPASVVTASSSVDPSLLTWERGKWKCFPKQPCRTPDLWAGITVLTSALAPAQNAHWTCQTSRVHRVVRTSKWWEYFWDELGFPLGSQIARAVWLFKRSFEVKEYNTSPFSPWWLLLIQLNVTEIEGCQLERN